MNEHILVGLASILLLGIISQWIAWRINIPSILLLLIAGFLIGPVSGFVDPDVIFGNLLFPIVSISVAVILYDGGLSLKLSEFREVGGTVRNMITIGLIVTGILSTLAAHFVLNLEISLAILLGAILVVTGPTVITPLLRFIRPTGRINSVLKWEGILNDPIGALLAVLVFESIVSGGLELAPALMLKGVVITVVIGGAIGLLAGYVVMVLLKHQLVPEYLQNPMSLTLVIAAFTASNFIQAESGLFAATVMGIFLANQKSVTVRHIIEFKENLSVLLISVLFVILAAKLKIADLEELGIASMFFLGILIIFVRPVAVFLSTIKSELNWREKLFLSWMAPRGIVAAAVASIFSLELVNAGYPQAERLVPLMFLVIIGTITIYGVSAMPIARWLKVTDANPQGVLILGAHPFARAIGKTLKDTGFKVLLIDTNPRHIAAARKSGLSVYHGSILSDDILDEIDLSGIGRLLAMTSNREVNSLAALYFAKIFGNTKMYQLALEESKESEEEAVTDELRGQNLFNWDISYALLEERFRQKATIKTTPITEKFDLDTFNKEKKDKKAIPLFLVDEDKTLIVFSGHNQPTPKPGQLLISMVVSGK